MSAGGNLHIAPGKTIEDVADDASNGASGSSFQELLALTYQSFNISHTVNKLRFGATYPGATHQLEGETRIVSDGHAMYQYYFQVVPTTFQLLSAPPIRTSQYSVTEHTRHVDPGSGRGPPGVFFYYEVSPLHVKYEEGRRGWGAFITGVAGVCGGVFVFMGMIDR